MKKSLLTMAMISLMATSAGATSFTSGLYTYTATSDSTVEVTSAASKDADGNTVTAHEVPATVQDADGKTYSVTTIGESAFKYSKAVSIVLPESIDSIKSQAFSSASSLVSLKLPSNLKFIGYYSMSSTALPSIEIPASVETIDDGAFFTCTKLTSIKFNNGLKKIGKSAFYKCPFTTVTLPESLVELGDKAFLYCEKLASIKLPSTLVTLGKGVFNYCSSLTSIDIPESVTSIGDECFLYCAALSKVSLPASVTTLGTSVFAATGIEEFTLASGNKNFTLVDGVLYSADKRLLYACPMKDKSTVNVDSKCVGINGGAFWGSAINKVVLPDGFLAIDEYAFCKSTLAEINLPSSMTFIGEQGFAATKLTSIVLPENMTEVADGLLAGCTELTSVTIPSAVKTIYNHAFHSDTKLTSVTCLGTTAPEFDDVFDTYDSPFYNVSTSTPLYVPKGSADSYKKAGWGSYLTITEQENSVVGYVGAKPADGTTFSKYLYMTVDVEFDADVTIVNSKPEVFIRKGSEESGAIKAPYDGWHATATSSNKVVRIWGDDGDGSVDGFTPEADTEYYLIIPAGIVKNEAGDLNERIVIKWNGPTTPKVVSLVSATPADGTVLDKYGNMTVELKFGADVTIANASPVVSLLKGDKTMGDKISPTSGWHVTAASDNASVRVWGDDGDGGVDNFKTEEGAEYYLIIPAGIVKDANGYANEEITLKWNGPEAKKTTLSVVSTNPADGKTFSKYCYMTVEVKFDADVTIVNATPDVTIRQNDKTSGKTITPDSGWHTTAASDNTTVRVWGDDGDGSPDSFTTEAGAVYYITIPAGIVKNAAGTLNDEIVITWNGPAAPKNVALVSATPADGTVLGTNADMTVELKFDAAVTIANATPSVSLLKDDKLMGDKISPANGWHATAASDNTTIRVWGDDGDGAVDYFKTEEGAEYYLVIPAGIVKDASGNANAEITLKWNGPAAKKALTVVSTTPADGSTFDKAWADMAFNITFSDDITILDYGPDAVLREGDATTGTKVEPDLYWKAVKEDSKTLRIWGSDYDYAVQTFQPKEGVKYYMTIPAGIVQNESGSKNEQIVIVVNGPEAAKAGLTVVGTTPADGSSIDPGYQDMKLYVTFSEDITVVKTAPAVVMRKNDATTGSIVEPMGYWRAQRSGTTKLYIWGDDGDGYTDTYNVEAGVTYYVTIPAGVVKNSAGTLNDEIVFEFSGTSTSGINGISAENGAVEVARYDINGRRVGENHKGMTVVRFSDGTVSKLFVK